MKVDLKYFLKILEYTDVTLFGKVQEKRKKSYISAVKSLLNKYGHRYFNLIEKGSKLGISIYTIKKYADKILNGSYISDDNYIDNKEIKIGGLNNGEHTHKHR